MRFWIQSVIVVVLLFYTNIANTAPQSIEHSHAKVLGSLLYNDLTVSWDEQPVSKILDQFQRELQIDVFVFWESDTKKGIDKDLSITLKLTNQPAIVVLERIIEKLNNGEPCAWQLRDGMLEVGLKDQFTQGRSMELRTYDVMSLLLTIRDFDNAPAMGTNNGGGSSGSSGGSTPSGGGGVGFGDPPENPKRPTKEEEAQKLIDTITDFVESEQWKVHGGNCTIRYYRGSLLVKAPDFVHRQLGGYSFIPLQPKNMKTRTIKFTGGSTSVRIPRVPNI
ncbi:MAG: hypothetical protein QF444_00075 [Phycisphaerales bacterium]|nr:hypothetical protein [Phycisphaerales bacterium]